MIITGTVNGDTSGSVTTTTPAAAAAGKDLYFYGTFDNVGGTVTGPTGASVVIAVGGGGGIDSGLWKIALAGAPAANYTVSTTAGGDVSLTIFCVDGEGGTFVSDTVVARTSGDSTTALSDTLTNPAADVVAGLLGFAFDTDATISTPPSGMTGIGLAPNITASEAIGYYEVGFTTGTKSLVWSTSEEWGVEGVVVRWTAPAGGVGGPLVRGKLAHQGLLLGGRLVCPT